MKPSTSIFIIYNPKSTGDSKSAAKDLERQLIKELPRTRVESIATHYAGHAEKLAYSLAHKHAAPLIVSSSGDGGYHEVINGVMKSSAEGKPAIAAVLPAGNANDHSRTMQDKPLWESIKKGKATQIDLLKVSVGDSTNKTHRYAHSYAGLGLTPIIATELNRHTLSAFNETILVLKTFFTHRPFKIRRNNKVITLDSLLFMNINQMAKVLTLAKTNQPDDGKFEVITFPHAHKFKLIIKLFKAATKGLETARRESAYSFEVIKKMPMQLDGEVTQLAPNSKVEVISAAKALATIV